MPISDQSSTAGRIASDHDRHRPLTRRVEPLELLGGIAVLAIEPEVRPPLLALDGTHAENWPRPARRATQAARAGLEMFGR
jgi:hypothetical protein